MQHSSNVNISPFILDEMTRGEGGDGEKCSDADDEVGDQVELDLGAVAGHSTDVFRGDVRLEVTNVEGDSQMRRGGLRPGTCVDNDNEKLETNLCGPGGDVTNKAKLWLAVDV